MLEFENGYCRWISIYLFTKFFGDLMSKYFLSDSSQNPRPVYISKIYKVSF